MRLEWALGQRFLCLGGDVPRAAPLSGGPGIGTTGSGAWKSLTPPDKPSGLSETATYVVGNRFHQCSCHGCGGLIKVRARFCCWVKSHLLLHAPLVLTGVCILTKLVGFLLGPSPFAHVLQVWMDPDHWIPVNGMQLSQQASSKSSSKGHLVAPA